MEGARPPPSSPPNPGSWRQGSSRRSPREPPAVAGPPQSREASPSQPDNSSSWLEQATFEKQSNSPGPPRSIDPDGEGVQLQLAGEGHLSSDAKEFDRLLHRLRQEHLRVQSECAMLHRQARERPPADGDDQQEARAPQEVDGARAENSSPAEAREADALDATGTGNDEVDALDARAEEWDNSKPASRLSQFALSAAAKTKSIGSMGARVAAASARKLTRSGSRFELEHDTGSSEYIRSQVTKIIEDKIAWKRKHGGKYFPIPGAKALKQHMVWVRHGLFADVTTFIIVANAIYLGVEAGVKLGLMQSQDDSLVWTEGHSAKDWLIAEWVFCILYLIEIVIRIAAYQVSFFLGSEKWWNASECVALGAMLAAATVESSGQSETTIVVLLKNLRFTRMLRVIRASKWKISLTLKTLVYTLSGSFQAFVSATLLIGIVIYGFSIIFLHGLREELKNANADLSKREMLREYFGSLDAAALTLLMSVSGGMDWQDVDWAVTDLPYLYLIAFRGYIIFTILCVLNVTTGVFVNAAFESAAQNRALAIETTHHKTLDTIHQVLEWFFLADVDLSGKVTLSQLRTLIGKESVRELLVANGFEVASAAQVFHLLDVQGTGEISPEDFVDGLIRLQGRAKAIDLAALRSVCDDLTHKIANIEAAMGKLAASNI